MRTFVVVDLSLSSLYNLYVGMRIKMNVCGIGSLGHFSILEFSVFIFQFPVLAYFNFSRKIISTVSYFELLFNFIIKTQK